MATIVNQNDTNTNVNSGAAPPGSVSAGPSGAGVNPGSSPMGSVMPVSSTPKAANSSGQFTNLQSYINANQGSGQNMANQISGRAQNQANQVNTGINNANGMIGSQIDAENNRIANASNLAGQVQAGNAQQITSDPNQLANWNQLYSGANNGQNIQNNASSAFANSGTAINNLQNTAQQAGTEQGRFGLLQQTLGRPTYNSGQQGLDQLLLQSGGGNNTLSQLQQNLASQANLANNNLTNDQSAIGSAINAINTNSTGAQGMLKNSIGSLNANDSGLGVVGTSGSSSPYAQNGGALNALQTALYQRQQAAINQGNAIQAEYAAGIADPTKMDAATMAALGLTQGEHIYDTDLSKYVTPTFNPGAVTEQGIANTTDLNQYNALNTLAGNAPGTGTYLTGQNIGGAPGVSLGSNASGLGAAIQANATQYNQLLGQLPQMQGNVTGALSNVNALINSNNLQGTPVPYTNPSTIGSNIDTMPTAPSSNNTQFQQATTYDQSLIPLLQKLQSTANNPAQLAAMANNYGAANSDWSKLIASGTGSGNGAVANQANQINSQLAPILQWAQNYGSLDPNAVIGQPGTTMNAIQAPQIR